MEKEKPRPPRPKHRTNVEQRELSPPPLPPRLSDFVSQEAKEQQPNAETSNETQEQRTNETKVEVDEKENRGLDRQESEKSETTSGDEKSKEARMSASSYVRELPLDALLPQTETPTSEPTTIKEKPVVKEQTPIAREVTPIAREVTPIAREVTPPPMYPKLEAPSVLPQIVLNGNLVENSIKMDHKNIYPNIQEAILHTELLNEAQLLAYYQNEQLDFIDDFVDEFVKRELNPRNTLYNLLEKFKGVCEQIQRNEDTKKTLAVALEHVNNEVWAVEDHKVSKTGRCGDEKTASGSTTYKKAKLIPGKLTELNQHLSDLTKYELDEGFSLETRARSLALQIQWIVVKLNKDFLSSHNLNTNTVPTLISSGQQNPSRSELIGALSDLFHFLRFPLLPSRFRDSVNLWVIELSSVLLKCCTMNNQMFLLSQILRLPSPIDWAIPLIQTYISIPNLDMKKPIDLFMALLGMILQPVHKRDDFLIEVLKYYEGENGWDFIGDNGEEDVNLTQLNDTDLIVLLGQFNIKALFLCVFQKFNSQHQGNRRLAMLSLISFTLMLLKIFNEGLVTYSGMKNVCKKICEFIRKTVQYVCGYWKCSADSFGNEKHVLQNEINRIILQAAFYIVSKKSTGHKGLWQFLVEFPFASATDFCRLRCLILLRNPGNTSVTQLYEISDAKLEETLASAKEGQLENSLERIGSDDRPYALSAIGALVASFENIKVHSHLNELLNVCFFDEQYREHYSKVGAEVLSVILDKKPQLLSHILKFIDRRMDHLDSSDIFSSASLVKCKLNEEEIGSLIGKWLINRPINHPASIIARRVLSSLDWGAVDDLFLPTSVHDICAETIVKAHVVHCKNRNNLISKSIAKAAKLALKCSDLEQNFDRFCHDLLIRLKISEKPLASSPQTDLTAFHVYLIEKCLSSPEKFLEEGLNYWVELVNSACFNNAIVILIKLTEKFPSRIHLFTANESFKQGLERLLHAEETYYVQTLIGNDKFPGPILRFISCGLANQLKNMNNESRLKQQINCWIQVLTCKKTTSWNEDKFVLHLLDIIAQVAFATNPSNCLGLIENFVSLYQAIHSAWINAPKGMLSWFSTHSPPTLISTALMDANPWISFMLLQAEHQIYSSFYSFLYQNLGKHPERSLEEAVKRAATKSNTLLGVDRLHFYRWLEFCTKESVISSEVFPLALQQLCIALLKRENFSGKKFCPGLRYFQCKQAEPLFNELRDKSLPFAEKKATFSQASSFIRSASQWIFNKSVYDSSFNQFNNFNMDYLLQMIVSNDNNLWTEFVNIPFLNEKIAEKSKMFVSYCQLTHANSPAHRQIDATNLTEFFRQLDVKEDFGLLIPEIPLHQNLPKCEFTMDDCFNMPVVVSRFNSYIEKFAGLAKQFMDSKDKIYQLNNDYGNEFQKLYNETQTTLIIQLKCGNFLSQQCRRPGKMSVVVNASHYNSAVAQTMNENRNKRESEVAQMLKSLDAAAIQSAQMEYFCWMLSSHAKMPQMSIGFMKGFNSKGDPSGLHSIGLHLFYRLCDNNRPELFLFTAATLCFENCLHYLGESFIHGNPNEQLNLMRLVLSQNPMNVYIIKNFTPQCLHSDALLSLYGELSTAMRSSSSTETSLSLLERLDIENANQLPSHHFSSLMPVIFENMASVPNTTRLHELCVRHFEGCMHHCFPDNFLQGLRLLLSGLDSHSVPTTILNSISKRLQMDEFIAQPSQKPTISVEIARQSIRLIAQQLMKSRQDLATNLYSVWLDYLDSISKFTDFFVRVIVSMEFSSDAPQSIIETSLREIFTHIVSVFGPLLEPVGPSTLPPFNPSDRQVAETIVVQRFVDLLIWLPHSTYLPPGSETTETLFWHFFIKKLLGIQKAGSSHVFSVYENQFSRLYWSRFWPNLLDLSALEHAFELSPDVGQFLTEVLIRIQWPQIVQQMEGQPEEAFRAFYSLMLNIFCRCVQNQKNYSKSRASVEKLISEFFVMGKWHYVKVETIEKVANYISTSFPSDSLINPSGSMSAFNNIWRESCFFSTKGSSVVPQSSYDLNPKLVAQKQAFYIRAYVHLMLHLTSTPKEDKFRMFKELLDKCYLLIGANQNLANEDLKIFVPIASELIVFWPEVPKEKLVEGFFTTLINWLNSHPDSILLLLLMNTAISSLGKSSPQTGLRLLDNCVSAYFKRRLNCDWSEVCRWIDIPDQMKEWLYTTPNSEGIETRFLTLNAHLLNEMSRLTSLQEEEKLMKRLADYLQEIKPKYITNEVAFLVCLEKYEKMVIRQFSNGVPIAVANERLEAFLNFLRKVTSEDKGVSFFNIKAVFGKKQAYPLKIQLFCSIIALYIQQQQTSVTQAPRMEPNKPILNSKIKSFRDLQQAKVFQEIENVSSVFQLADPFFTKPELHTIQHVSKLFYQLSIKLYPDSQKLLLHLDS